MEFFRYPQQRVQFYISVFARLGAIRPVNCDRVDMRCLAEAKVTPRIARREIAGVGVTPSPLHRQPAGFYGDTGAGSKARPVDLNRQPVAAWQIVAQQA